ncbi:MAG: hypothetical protein ACHP7N_07290 [Caulobacterales bacterium]
MTDAIQPVRRPARARPYGRRGVDQPAEANAPTAVTPVEPAPAAPTPPPAGKAAAAFAAQLIAGPQRRGLRAGPTTLGDAKSAYLGAEWSGGADRRTIKGRITKTEI